MIGAAIIGFVHIQSVTMHHFQKAGETLAQAIYFLTLIIAAIFLFTFYTVPQFLAIFLLFLLMFLPFILILSKMKK